jgi:predicted phage terminase large subunit-like protein
MLPGDNLIKLDWFGTYEGRPRKDGCEAIAQSWDTASVSGIDNDYSICATRGLINDKIDLVVHKPQYHCVDLLCAARTLRTKWQPKLIVVEQAGVGIALGNDLLRDGFRDVQALNPKGDKMQRLSPQSAEIEARQVRLPKSAPWLEQFLTEMSEAPNGRYDDQLDSVSQMLRALDTATWPPRGISRYRR